MAISLYRKVVLDPKTKVELFLGDKSLGSITIQEKDDRRLVIFTNADKEETILSRRKIVKAAKP